MQPRADHQRPGLVAVRLEQARNVLRAVLPVAVERDHRLGVVGERDGHAAPQARRLAQVARVADQRHRQALERDVSAVDRSIVDHYDAGDLGERALGYAADGGGLVVGRDDDR